MPNKKTKRRSEQPRKLPARGSYKRAESRTYVSPTAGKGKSRSNQPRSTVERVAMEGGYREKYRKSKDTIGLNKKAK